MNGWLQEHLYITVCLHKRTPTHLSRIIIEKIQLRQLHLELFLK